MSFDEINDVTGFAEGSKFKDEADVRRYFTQAAQKEIFRHEDPDSQESLNEMANTVIANRWHMEGQANA